MISRAAFASTLSALKFARAVYEVGGEQIRLGERGGWLYSMGRLMFDFARREASVAEVALGGRDGGAAWLASAHRPAH